MYGKTTPFRLPRGDVRNQHARIRRRLFFGGDLLWIHVACSLLALLYSWSQFKTDKVGQKIRAEGQEKTTCSSFLLFLPGFKRYLRYAMQSMRASLVITRPPLISTLLPGTRDNGGRSKGFHL